MRNLKLSICVIIATLTVAGCGGSNSAPPATGKVAVMLTDGPTDQFEQILITLDRMLLLGGNGGHQVLYEGPPITFDLLALRDRADFAFSSEVLADDYSKIRLEVSEIQLVDITSPTGPLVVTLVDLPANGKIDLNPQGPFTVAPGQTTVVELDMDAKRSFQIVETGNPIPRYKLRPVIFVNVYPGDIILPGKLVRVFGTVNSVTDSGTEPSALVCDLHFVARLGTPVAGDPEHCVRIFANENTSIFGENGLVTNFQTIAPEDELTGIGFLTPNGTDALFSLDAIVMQLGGHQPPSVTGWETLRGIVVSPQGDCDMIADSEQCFDFKPNDTDTPIKTRLQAATRVFNSRGSELAHTDINDTDTGTVDGLRISNGTDELLAALVVLSLDVGDELVSGVLTDVVTGDPYDILTVDSTAVCVDAETDVLRILVDDEVVTIIDLLDPAVLDPAAGHMVDVAGTLSEVGVTGCNIIADVVIVE